MFGNSKELYPGNDLAGFMRPHEVNDFSLRSAVIAAVLSFIIALGLRLTELPMWDNPYYKLGDEHLLATHDAYHWIAGAAGFEFGAGHPMSELAGFGGWVSGLPFAEAAFWMVPLLASLTAVAVTAWGAQLGYPFAGMAAGIMTSLAPGFLGRTTLGCYDTDLITLLFAIMLGFVPAAWLKNELIPPLPWLYGRIRAYFNKYSPAPHDSHVEPGQQNRIFWSCLLYAAGMFGFWTQEWHSLFPYMTRCLALFTPILILFFARAGRRALLLREALLFALPMLNFPYGFLLGLALLSGVVAVELRRRETCFKESAVVNWLQSVFYPENSKKQSLHVLFLLLLWVAVLFLSVVGDIWETLQASIMSYLKLNVEAPRWEADKKLPFPAVAQSIIEVHDIKLKELFIYLHPWSWLAALGLSCFIVLLFFFPGLAYLAPLGAIAVSSLKLGGRMGMFGAPIASLGLFITLAALSALCKQSAGFKENRGLNLSCAMLLGLLLCLPIVNKIPGMSQGPSISKEHAEALSYLRGATPEDSMLWLWWDWGYAAHHFAQRHTIADGARHGGPSLFLPAMVYTTDNPYLARQVIKHTAKNGNSPGAVFEDLDAKGVTQLLKDLATGPPVQAEGKQYLIVNFDIIPISLWISYFGSWDFIKQRGKDYLVNNLDKDLQYNFNSGIIVQQELRPLYASSIDIFSPHGLQRRSYFKINERHFIFNNRTHEKVVVDEDLYKTLMIQLLLCEPGDTRFTPYFDLVFDNVMARVYEVK